MSRSFGARRALALLASGAAIGAAGGYAVSASGASPSTHEPPHATAKKASTARRLGRLRRAVSLTAVLPTRGGTFATFTIERGELTGVAGDQLTLREGTRRATFRTVTTTVDAQALVRLSGKPSSLSALAPGERVRIVQGPRRTVVLARAPGKSGATRGSLGEG